LLRAFSVISAVHVASSSLGDATERSSGRQHEKARWQYPWAKAAGNSSSETEAASGAFGDEPQPPAATASTTTKAARRMPTL
jgi:hypothetical protein